MAWVAGELVFGRLRVGQQVLVKQGHEARHVPVEFGLRAVERGVGGVQILGLADARGVEIDLGSFIVGPECDAPDDGILGRGSGDVDGGAGKRAGFHRAILEDIQPADGKCFSKGARHVAFDLQFGAGFRIENGENILWLAIDQHLGGFVQVAPDPRALRPVLRRQILGQVTLLETELVLHHIGCGVELVGEKELGSAVERIGLGAEGADHARLARPSDLAALGRGRGDLPLHQVDRHFRQLPRGGGGGISLG